MYFNYLKITILRQQADMSSGVPTPPFGANDTLSDGIAKCPKWRIRLLDLDGSPLSGKSYSLENGRVTGILDGAGYSEVIETPINETLAANGLSGYVMFPDLKILPDFERLWQGYPAGSSIEAAQTAGGKIEELFVPALSQTEAERQAMIARGEEPSAFTNTCVVRTSRAFNQVGRDFIPFVGEHDHETGQGNDGRGHGIPRGNIGVPLTMYAGADTWPDGRNKAYAFRVSEFKKYMPYYYPDAPKIVGSTDASQFLGARGVIWFDVAGWSDASGHFDIWNGFGTTRNELIRYSEYFSNAGKTTLWQHVVIRLEQLETSEGVCTAVYRYFPR